jgi:hypothetical protein
MLVAQKMALERRIEQARQEEVERQRRLEAERLAVQQAEMKKYNLTEDQLLRGQEEIFKIKKTKLNEVPGKGLTLQEMRMFYAKMQ